MYLLPTNPLPLKKMTVAAAGTLIRLTAGLVGSLVDPYLPADNADQGQDLRVHLIHIKAPPGNTGAIYFGYFGMNRTTLVGVLRVIDKGENFTLVVTNAGNPFRLGDFYVDADTNGDTCHGYVAAV